MNSITRPIVFQDRYLFTLAFNNFSYCPPYNYNFFKLKVLDLIDEESGWSVLGIVTMRVKPRLTSSFYLAKGSNNTILFIGSYMGIYEFDIDFNNPKRRIRLYNAPDDKYDSHNFRRDIDPDLAYYKGRVWSPHPIQTNALNSFSFINKELKEVTFDWKIIRIKPFPLPTVLVICALPLIDHSKKIHSLILIQPHSFHLYLADYKL